MASIVHTSNTPRPGDAERRRYARASVRLPISATLDGGEIRILCSNISIGGARCHSESPIPVMTRLDVALRLPAGMGSVAGAIDGTGGSPRIGNGELICAHGAPARAGVRRSARTVPGAGAGEEEVHFHAVVVRCEPDPARIGTWDLALFFVETESAPLERLARYVHEQIDAHTV